MRVDELANFVPALRIQPELPLQILPSVFDGVDLSNSVRISGIMLRMGGMAKIAGIVVAPRNRAGHKETFLSGDQVR